MMMDKDNSRQAGALEITDEMIHLGVAELRGFIGVEERYSDGDDEVVRSVFSAMLGAAHYQ
jgi:hypothetical protein